MLEIKVGSILMRKATEECYIVTNVDNTQLFVTGFDGVNEYVRLDDLDDYVVVYENLRAVMQSGSNLDTQHGGDHYKKLGEYQPWKVLKSWLTPEEFRGYMKGTAIAYLAREGDKGKDLDISKAGHTLQAFMEMIK